MLVKSKDFIPTLASVTFPAKVGIKSLDFTSICIVPAMMLANYLLDRLATAGKYMIFISCFLTFYCGGQSLLPF